jgi:hypothetical protein
VVLYAPNYELSEYVVVRAIGALSAQINAFEIQFKPFYTKPKVLRARAVSKISLIFKYVLVLCAGF